MNVKDFFLLIISRLICGIGMTLALVSTVYSIWCFFFSQKPYHLLFGFLGVIGFFIGYGFYKFALKYVYDELSN